MEKSKQIYSELQEEIRKSNPSSQEYVSYLTKSAIPEKDASLSERTAFIVGKNKMHTQKGTRRKKAYLTRKEKEIFGILKCPKTGWVYKDFESLRELWRTYIKDYLGLKGCVPKPDDMSWANFSLRVARADYHGSELTVIRSKCPNIVGTSGTCILETRNTFGILSADNKYRIIPKHNSVFQFVLDSAKYTIFGKYLLMRPAERSSKKIKSHIIPDL